MTSLKYTSEVASSIEVPANHITIQEAQIFNKFISCVRPELLLQENHSSRFTEQNPCQLVAAIKQDLATIKPEQEEHLMTKANITQDLNDGATVQQNCDSVFTTQYVEMQELLEIKTNAELVTSTQEEHEDPLKTKVLIQQSPTSRKYENEDHDPLKTMALIKSEPKPNIKQETGHPNSLIINKHCYPKQKPSSIEIKKQKSCTVQLKKSHKVIGTAPYFNVNTSNIKIKAAYHKNIVSFINEEGKCVKYLLNPKHGMNFDNVYSERFPKLTVQLERCDVKVTNKVVGSDYCFSDIDFCQDAKVPQESLEPQSDSLSLTECVPSSASTDEMAEYEKSITKAINDIDANPNAVSQPLLVYFCKKCQLPYDNVNALIKHKHKFHFNSLAKYVDNMYRAPVIKKVKVDPDLDIKPDIQFVCHICNFQALTKSHLDYHINSHWAAASSSKESSGSGQLMSYDYKHKVWYSVKTVPFSAPKVLDNVPNANGRSKTIKTVPRYVCCECNKMYRGVHSFNDHAVKSHYYLLGRKNLKKIIHIDPRDDPLDKEFFGRALEPKSYTCKVCQLKFSSKAETQSHMMSAHCESDSD